MEKIEIPELLNDYQTGYSLAQPFYVNEQIFQHECETIFKNNWLYAGNTTQIPNSGDYFLYQFQRNSIIIIRGNNGAVHAHYNTCAHRGSAICLTEKGHTSRLVCPYHQWVYDKNGTLLNARTMPDDFCKEEHNLQSVFVEEVEGLIFICLSKLPPDFSKIKNSLTPYLYPFDISKAKVAVIKDYELDANWKLIAENFRECYHCGGAHPEYCNAVIGANLKENTEELTLEKQLIWKAKGLATNLIEVENGTTTYAVRYPLRPNVESYSVDCKKTSIPMGKHQDYDAGVVGLVNYPNFWMDAVSDYIWIMKLIPLNAAKTKVEFCWLVDEKAIENVDYTLERLTEFWERTGEQDGKLCENNYKGILTNGYKSGPYSPVEDQVVNFVEWCIKEMKKG